MKRLVLLAAVILGAGCARAGAGGDSGIEGRVLLGPQCPVVSEATPCPDEPVATQVVVMSRDGEEVARGRSGSDGRFRIALDPGSYVVQAMVAGNALFAKPVDVTVTSGQYVNVIVPLDTGIRDPLGEGTSSP
jgi:hypothetical protein